MDAFYEDIGGKLKAWAKVIFALGAVATILGGLVMLFNDAAVAGLITLVVGPISALISTWLLYAFGELVEKTAANEENTRAILNLLKSKQAPKPTAPVTKPSAKHAWRCSSCGEMTTQAPCPHCGYTEETAPFHCGKCGHEGPYGGACPSCGSMIRIFN